MLALLLPYDVTTRVHPYGLACEDGLELSVGAVDGQVARIARFVEPPAGAGLQSGRRR